MKRTVLARICRFAVTQSSVVLSVVRELLVRLKYQQVSVGSKVHLGAGVVFRVSDGGSVVVGAHTSFGDHCVVIVRGGSLVIGADTFIGWGQ